MSNEKIRRKRFSEEVLSDTLAALFSKAEELLELGARTFPEKRDNEVVGFTFNFGLEEPRSLFILGEKRNQDVSATFTDISIDFAPVDTDHLEATIENWPRLTIYKEDDFDGMVWVQSEVGALKPTQALLTRLNGLLIREVTGVSSKLVDTDALSKAQFPFTFKDIRIPKSD